jgi:phosphate transport system protein
MPRNSMDHQLHQLEDEVLLLGSMVEQAVLKSVDALRLRDSFVAHKIIVDDHFINEKRFAIENNILIIIATQQPMAKDLRLLTAMLEVITELERMGDYAKGIGKVVIRLEDSTIPVPNHEISQMADLAVSMLHRSLGAFIAENTSVAVTIPKEDDAVDGLYNRIYSNIVATMIANPETIDHANLILWVAHNLERMADRVTNICERTVFITTGELLELDESDDEDSE